MDNDERISFINHHNPDSDYVALFVLLAQKVTKPESLTTLRQEIAADMGKSQAQAGRYIQYLYDRLLAWVPEAFSNSHLELSRLQVTASKMLEVGNFYAAQLILIDAFKLADEKEDFQKGKDLALLFQQIDLVEGQKLEIAYLKKLDQVLGLELLCKEQLPRIKEQARKGSARLVVASFKEDSRLITKPESVRAQFFQAKAFWSLASNTQSMEEALYFSRKMVGLIDAHPAILSDQAAVKIKQLSVQAIIFTIIGQESAARSKAFSILQSPSGSLRVNALIWQESTRSFMSSACEFGWLSGVGTVMKEFVQKFNQFQPFIPINIQKAMFFRSVQYYICSGLYDQAGELISLASKQSWYRDSDPYKFFFCLFQVEICISGGEFDLAWEYFDEAGQQIEKNRPSPFALFHSWYEEKQSFRVVNHKRFMDDLAQLRKSEFAWQFHYFPMDTYVESQLSRTHAIKLIRRNANLRLPKHIRSRKIT